HWVRGAFGPPVFGNPSKSPRFWSLPWPAPVLDRPHDAHRVGPEVQWCPARGHQWWGLAPSSSPWGGGPGGRLRVARPAKESSSLCHAQAAQGLVTTEAYHGNADSGGGEKSRSTP